MGLVAGQKSLCLRVLFSRQLDLQIALVQRPLPQTKNLKQGSSGQQRLTLLNDDNSSSLSEEFPFLVTKEF